ncbi:MAG: transposase [Planctomycetales bacterium]|nr:transposase [Planctomycetales bacterium]
MASASTEASAEHSTASPHKSKPPNGPNHGLATPLARALTAHIAPSAANHQHLSLAPLLPSSESTHRNSLGNKPSTDAGNYNKWVAQKRLKKGSKKAPILNCDRAKMYLDGKRLQWCWAHLKRDFQKLIDSPDGQVKRMGHDLMRQHRALFEHWRKYKAGKIKWRTFQNYAAPIREEVRALLLRGKFSGNKKLVGFCRELYDRREHLWTFTRVEGIEPTNNTAERALRPAVIYRKLSFGTQSANGSRYLERILTVSETCRLQNRNASIPHPGDGSQLRRNPRALSSANRRASFHQERRLILPNKRPRP